MNDKTKKLDLEKRLRPLKEGETFYYDEETKEFSIRKTEPKRYKDYERSGKENPKKSTKDGDVISGGKVLPTMEAAKGGMVKKYKHGGSVKKNTMATTKGWGKSRKT